VQSRYLGTGSKAYSYCPYPSTAFEIVEAVLCRLRLGEQERRTCGKHSVARHDPPRAKGLSASLQGQQQDDPAAATAPCTMGSYIPNTTELIISFRSAILAGRAIRVEYEAPRAPRRADDHRRRFSFPLMRSSREHVAFIFFIEETCIALGIANASASAGSF